MLNTATSFMNNLGVQKLMGENLKVVWAKFSTLSWAVLIISATAWYRQKRQHFKLKTQLRFCPVNLSLSMEQPILVSCNIFSSRTIKHSLVS